LEALHLISKRSHSYFDLTLLNLILIIILLSIAILIGLISIKLIYYSSNSHPRRKLQNHRNDTNTLYRLQGPTETQLPLLDNGPGEQSLTSSLIISGNNRLTQDENDEDEQQQVKPTDGTEREKEKKKEIHINTVSICYISLSSLFNSAMIRANVIVTIDNRIDFF